MAGVRDQSKGKQHTKVWRIRRVSTSMFCRGSVSSRILPAKAQKLFKLFIERAKMSKHARELYLSHQARKQAAVCTSHESQRGWPRRCSGFSLGSRQYPCARPPCMRDHRWCGTNPPVCDRAGEGRGHHEFNVTHACTSLKRSGSNKSAHRNADVKLSSPNVSTCSSPCMWRGRLVSILTQSGKRRRKQHKRDL